MRLTLRSAVVVLAFEALSCVGQSNDWEAGATSSSPGVEATEQELKGSNAAGTNFSGVNQGGRNQGGVNQGGVNQAGLNQGGVNLGGANLGGTNLGGANLAGANQAGVNQAGANQGGLNLGGANLAGNNLAGGNLGGANVGGSNLAGANQAAANLAGANLAGANLGGANQAGVNQAGSNQAGANLMGANLGGTNLGGANQAGANLAGANQAGSNLGGANLAGANLVAPNLAGNNFGPMSQAVDMHWVAGKGPAAISGQTLAPKMLYSGEDAWAGVPAQGKNPCVVLGIGSTAFARLIAANKPVLGTDSPYMYATIKKLPWGFTDTYQGAIKARAWEAVIWGAKTYCSFIVLSPYDNNVDVDPKGVAGFVKAVFRWAAPSTQFLITKYNAGDGVTGAETTYPTLAADGYAAFNGMMNAGTFAATYPDAYVGGLANFASATTNNVSVNVDFASSITLPDAGLQILANVDPSAAKYYEGRWATFNIGGQASVKHMQTDSSTTHSTKYGVPETATIAWSAYRAWKAGLIAARPVPRRCSSALAMQSAFLTGLPAGKCDDGVGIASSLLWLNRQDLSYCDGTGYAPNTTWTKALGGNPVAMNAYMEGSHVCSNDYPYVRRLPVAETHIHSTDFPLEVGTEDWIIADHRFRKDGSFLSDPAVSTQVLAPTQDDIVKIYDLGTPGVTAYPADSAFVDWYYASTCTRTRPLATEVLIQRGCVPKFNGRVDPVHAQYRLFKNNAATASAVTWDIGVDYAANSSNKMTLRYGAVRAGSVEEFSLSHVWTTPTAGQASTPSTMPASVKVGLFATGAADSSPTVLLPVSSTNGGISSRSEGIAGNASGYSFTFAVPANVPKGAYNLRAFDNGVKFATSEFLIVTAPTGGDLPVKKVILAGPDQMEVGDCVFIGANIENLDYEIENIYLNSYGPDGGVAPLLGLDCDPFHNGSSPRLLHTLYPSYSVRPTEVGTIRIASTANPTEPACASPLKCGPVQMASKTIKVVPPTRSLQLSGQTLSGGACADLAVSRLNKANTLVADATALTVELRAPALAGAFYSDSSCASTVITKTVIAAGQTTSPTFYFKKTGASTTVTAMSTAAFSASMTLKGNGASFVSQTVPTTMITGVTYPVSVTMKNTGSVTWTPGTTCGSFRLGSMSRYSTTTLINLDLGISRVNLTSSVAPGANGVFTFNIVAPAHEMPFVFQWSMMEECGLAFGGASTPVSVSVSYPHYDAVQVSATTLPNPTPVAPALTPMTVVMRNSGTATWTPQTSLSIMSFPSPGLWGIDWVPVTTPVPPGGTFTFTFNVAPAAPASYPASRDFVYTMYDNDPSLYWSPHGSFGPALMPVPVQLTASAPPAPPAVPAGYSSTVVYQGPVPPSMPTPYPAQIFFDILNTGTEVWMPGTVTVRNLYNGFDVSRVELLSPVPPGVIAHFDFQVRSTTVGPSVPMQWQLSYSGSPFGGKTTLVNVSVPF